MPFPSSGTYPISSKDVVSFTFDNPSYDVNRPVLIDPADPSIHFTHTTAKDLVQKLIAGLHKAGLQRGDTVCVHSFNSLQYPLLVLAIIGAGGISVGTNPSYTKPELSHAVKLAKIKFVLSEPEILSNVQTALQENGVDVGQRLFILDTQREQQVPPGLKSWKTLLSQGKDDWIRFDDRQKAQQHCQLYFTSGTSGLPKCAMTSHRNLVAEHQIFYEKWPRSYPYRVVYCMPFFHVGIFPGVFVSTLREGREAYVMRRFELKPYLQYHAKYRITEVFSVPPMLVSIVMSGMADPKSKNYNKEYSLKSVKNGTVGAAPCSADLQKRFQDLLADGATMGQVWGMTETTTMATIVPWTVAGKVSAMGSIGKPLSEVQMKLIDENGNDVTDAGKGELCVKGPTVIQGYFENEKANRESWDDEGYFKTGDVIQADPKTGLMYVVERVKELIKVRGFQVAPAELEGVLLSHADIVDAGVIGIPGENESEMPRAFLVRREGTKIQEAEVQAFMKQNLAGYKQLSGGVVFVNEIPKLPSGKILKRVLREMEKQEGGKLAAKL